MKETCKQTQIGGNVQNTSTSQPFQVQDKKKGTTEKTVRD